MFESWFLQPDIAWKDPPWLTLCRNSPHRPSGKLPGSVESCQGIITGVQRPSCFMHLVIIIYLYQAPEVRWAISGTERSLRKQITLKLTCQPDFTAPAVPAWGAAIHSLERELQIILSPGHGPNPCHSLPASERQIRSIYRAGKFFFQGEFSTWVSFSDTFRQSLRFWSFNTLPLHPTFTHIYVNKSTFECTCSLSPLESWSVSHLVPFPGPGEQGLLD